jgi:TusA-related sulfurtransferase
MPRSPASSSPPTAPSPGDGEPTVLDLAGEVCPFTFVRTKLALEALPIGARLRVLVDHPPARDNVPRSAIAWGQDVVGVADLGGRWLIEILKRVE